MRFGLFVPAALASMLAAENGFAQSAGASGLTAGTAERMTAACVAYAQAHKAAVNIWVYDANGGMLHFQRMDGAPPMGTVLGSGGGSFGLGPEPGPGSFDDPTTFNPGAPGAVPVILNGRTVGTVRAAGMGPIGDRACARAAADAAAAGAAPKSQGPR